jgi:hypothetical protein
MLSDIFTSCDKPASAGGRFTVLDASDESWRSLWRRYGRVETIAASLGLHCEDVRVRLRAAGVSLRGRPRLGLAPAEVPTHRAGSAPHGTQLLVPGLCVLG